MITRNMKVGYLRKNGVPVSQDAVVTEQFDRHDEPGGDAWITVTTVVDDPANLIVSSSFRKEAASQRVCGEHLALGAVAFPAAKPR